MVLEQLYSAEWIEQRSRYAFIMGFAYSIIGMASALFLFPEDPALVAVAFTSLLIVPSLNKLFSIEENKEAREQTFNLIGLFKDHIDLFNVYFFLFMGILVTFALFAVILPSVATSRLFEQQLAIVGLAGKAYASYDTFLSILSNNFRVLVFCFLASFIYGAGSIFIITWNASVWGAVFGAVAKHSADVSGNPVIYLFVTLGAVFPHMFTEASSYFLAAISGGVISKATLREKFGSPEFTRILQDALILFGLSLVVLVIAAYIEVYVTEKLMVMFNIA